MMVSQGLGLGMQLTSFVFIARALGVQDYGLFIGITAFAAILVPFVGVGSGEILVKQVARDRSLFDRYWGETLFTVLASGALLVGISFFTINAIIPSRTSPLLIFLILLSDLFFLKLWEVSVRAFMCVDLVGLAAKVKLFLNFNKLIAAAVLLFCFKDPSIGTWTVLYLSATAIAAIGSLLLIAKLIAPPQLIIPKLDSEIIQGVYFSIGLSADSINAGIDKTMLASLSTAEATGLYAAAYRCIDAGYLGLQAISGAAYAKFFQQGAKGIKGSLGFAKRLFPVVSAYGAIVCVGFFLCAPVIPRLLGAEYANSVEAVRWLAPVPLLMCLQYLAADTLTGSGFQGIRSIVQVSSALLNVALNFWLIPLYAWKGSAWATLASETMRLVSLCLVVAYLYYQQVKPAQDA